MSSHEYEWDYFSEPSKVDMDVDVIHTYSSQIEVVDESYVGSDGLDFHITLVDHAGPSTINLDLYSFGAFSIGSTSLITRAYVFHINNLEASTSLSLLLPYLIEWSIQDQRPELPSFQ